MTTSFILVIGSVPSKLYDLVRMELRRGRRQDSLRVLRLDASVVDDLNDIHDFSVNQRDDMVRKLRTIHSDFEPGSVRAIVATDDLPSLENIFRDIWGTVKVGSVLLPYYQLEELNDGSRVLIGSGIRGIDKFEPKS